MLVIWPSVNKVLSRQKCELWREKGYKTCVIVDGHPDPDFGADYVVGVPKWEGYASACNAAAGMFKSDVYVFAADDIYPDPEHDAGVLELRFKIRFPGLYGVAQPTGDKFAAWNRCAVSPWVGSEWVARHGPYHTGYFHYFCDEELQAHATQEGVFEQWDDVNQYHEHWMRDDKHPGTLRSEESRPEHLLEARNHWQKDSETFRRRKDNGFRL